MKFIEFYVGIFKKKDMSSHSQLYQLKNCVNCDFNWACLKAWLPAEDSAPRAFWRESLVLSIVTRG
jgi:hypothetical protein